MSETVERDQETLELFVEESLEALTRVEQMLLDAERGTPRADMMSWLFRDIHTIKGTSGFLALPRILSLSRSRRRDSSGPRTGD